MILLTALALAAAAQDCDSANQLELNACADAEYARADAALNAAYRAAMARVRADEAYMSTDDGRPAGDVLLRDAQRAWVAQRDQMCQLEAYDVRGGQAEPAVYDGCRAEVTRERTAWLEQLATANAR